MKVGAKKCSLKKHTDINAISFCQDCSIYLCNKCQNYHSELFENHKIYPFKGDEENISLDICRVENHSKYKLNYYCKTHKQLVCVACLCKIKDDMNGQSLRNAVKASRCAMLDSFSDGLVYGNDAIKAAVAAALRDTDYPNGYAVRLKRQFEHVSIMPLLKASIPFVPYSLVTRPPWAAMFESEENLLP